MHVVFRNLKNSATIAACRERLVVMAGNKPLAWENRDCHTDPHDRHLGKGQQKLAL